MILWLFGVLQVLDWVSTLAVLNAGGVEGNPIMAQVVGNPLLFAVVKVLSVVVVWAALRLRPRLVAPVVVVLCVFYSVVVVNNLLVLLWF